jgi:hypothetical protein
VASSPHARLYVPGVLCRCRVGECQRIGSGSREREELARRNTSQLRTSLAMLKEPQIVTVHDPGMPAGEFLALPDLLFPSNDHKVEDTSTTTKCSAIHILHSRGTNHYQSTRNSDLHAHVRKTALPIFPCSYFCPTASCGKPQQKSFSVLLVKRSVYDRR